MNPRNTLLLLLVAAALGAFVWFYEIRGAEERQEEEAAAKELYPAVEPTAVSWIELETSDGRKARAERHDGAWELVEPLAFPGDAVNLDAMAAGLADLAREQVIEDPQPPEVYGLGDEAKVVRFGTGDTEYGLRIGKNAPMGSNSYVATAEAPARIVTVPTFRVTNLQRSLDDLRDRRVLNFDRASIASVQLEWPEGGVTLVRQDDGWSIASPIQAAADETTVDQLLSNLSYLRADGFEDAPPPDAETGLDEPAFAVTLTTRSAADDEGPTSFHMAMGMDRDGQRLVRSGGQHSLYRVPAQRIDDFQRSVMAYRQKELARFVATDAKEVVLEFRSGEGEPVRETLRYGDAGWTGVPDPVDPGRVARLVAELARLRGAGIASDAADAATLERLGLSPPRVGVRVFGATPADGAPPVLAEVELGLAAEGEGPAARKPGGDTVYLLPASLNELLPTTPSRFAELYRPVPAGEESTEGAGPDGADASEDATPFEAEPVDEDAAPGMAGQEE